MGASFLFVGRRVSKDIHDYRSRTSGRTYRIERKPEPEGWTGHGPAYSVTVKHDGEYFIPLDGKLRDHYGVFRAIELDDIL